MFRAVFRDHAARVVVVTAPGAPAPVGLTATSLASVSLDPPMVSFAVAAGASAWPVMATAPRLGVHLLDHGQDWLATRFATSGVDRFAEPVRWHPGWPVSRSSRAARRTWAAGSSSTSPPATTCSSWPASSTPTSAAPADR